MLPVFFNLLSPLVKGDKIRVLIFYFTDMSWENHGEWHIDHIIPIKYKENKVEPTLKDIIKRLHYTNTQPLWAEENTSKGNRYIR